MTNAKIKWIKHVENGDVPTRQAADTYEEQKRIIDEVWDEMKVGARLLYYEIKRRRYVDMKESIHAV
ncbi:MAG: hypothetical protein H5T50_10660 [Nitrososphaeria archaeon]|nr:hypothetical protein [Nitrososphaeria archaeon]